MVPFSILPLMSEKQVSEHQAKHPALQLVSQLLTALNQERGQLCQAALTRLYASAQTHWLEKTIEQRKSLSTSPSSQEGYTVSRQACLHTWMVFKFTLCFWREQGWLHRFVRFCFKQKLDSFQSENTRLGRGQSLHCCFSLFINYHSVTGVFFMYSKVPRGWKSIARLQHKERHRVWLQQGYWLDDPCYRCQTTQQPWPYLAGQNDDVVQQYFTTFSFF